MITSTEQIILGKDKIDFKPPIKCLTFLNFIPQERDIVGPAGRGSLVKVDPEKYIASEGSIRVMDLGSGQKIKEIIVDLHSSALTLSPGSNYLVGANLASDNLGVINPEKNEVIGTIWVKKVPLILLELLLMFFVLSQMAKLCSWPMKLKRQWP